MNALDTSRTRLQPASEQERQLVRDELASVLATPHFASSKRYPAFLRYVVEKTLEGDGSDLKERTLGVDVFQRRPDYDTNSDTVVRVAAGEVRKRLALVYHQSDHQHAIQIALPAGSYIPEFLRATEMEVPAHAGTSLAPPPDRQMVPLPDEPHSTPRPPAPPIASWLRSIFALALVVLGILLATIYTGLRNIRHETSVDQFWQPIRLSNTPVILCAGALVPSVSNETGFTEADKKDDYPYVSIVTADVLTSLVDLLARNRTGYLVQPASSTTLTDLRTHPSVLIGAYNNKWTNLMLGNLRYRLLPKPAIGIYDSTDPSKVWTRPDALPYKDKEDYAIIARFHDKLSDNTVIVIGGLGKNGTEAAAQFLTTPHYLDLLGQQQQGRDWASKNIEIVLKTTVVDSKTGAPSIEAVYSW